MLDTILSVGLLGMLPYFSLLGFCFWRVAKSPYRGSEVVALAYFAFTFTWFECAQFTHLAWWSLSLWGVNSKWLIADSQTSRLNRSESMTQENLEGSESP